MYPQKRAAGQRYMTQQGGPDILSKMVETFIGKGAKLNAEDSVLWSKPTRYAANHYSAQKLRYHDFHGGDRKTRDVTSWDVKSGWKQEGDPWKFLTRYQEHATLFLIVT